jgi:hypothetical protein
MKATRAGLFFRIMCERAKVEPASLTRGFCEQERKMTAEPETGRERDALSGHILAASVVMIGVATTLIGLVKVAKEHMKEHMGPTRADQYAGLAAVLFFLSAGASYLSIRHADRPSLSRRCEWIADQIFVCGLLAISAIAVFFAFELI